jgi:hypothetical protein
MIAIKHIDRCRVDSFACLEVFPNVDKSQTAQITALTERVGQSSFQPASTAEKQFLFASQRVRIKSILSKDPSRSHQKAIDCNQLLHDLSVKLPIILSNLLSALTTNIHILANGSGSA